ncbi:MAG: hypothetical protein EAX86_12510 [Candidatus Heimdallarchaeota archaeon]|nr:hypothetical protein [Candidatus Heimdallarchaeota archaeon]
MEGFSIRHNQTEDYTLSEHEKEFLTLYGKIFEIRRSNNFGRIFALLTLKARFVENGLDQQEIVDYFNTNFPNNSISVSTVSRILAKMERSKYCESIPSQARKRKYFTQANFSQLTIERISYNIKEGEDLILKLQKLANNLTDDEKTKNPYLIDVIKNLEQVYEIITEYYKVSLQKIIHQLEEINT